MKKNTKPLFPEKLYHIYNRGINGENLFRQERNYQYFLSKYRKFLSPVAELYTYCLLKNHFHFLIEVRREEEIIKYFVEKNPQLKSPSPDQLISKAFNSFFKSYSVTINRTYDRTGRLFEEPFLRIEINSSSQITNLIKYIHLNPQKHGFVQDFQSYAHSSFHILKSVDPTWLAKEKVMDWFGGVDEFISIHEDASVLAGSHLDLD